MRNFFQNRYINVVLGYAISIIGLTLYDWELNNVLFYIFLYHLIKVPTYISLSYRLHNKSSKEAMAFSVVLFFIFLGYALFFVILIDAVSPKSYHSKDSFIAPFAAELGNLIGAYGIPLLTLILVEFLTYRLKYRKVLPDIDRGSKLLFRLVVYYGSQVPILIIAAATQSNEFHLSDLVSSIIILSIFLLTDMYWYGRRKILEFDTSETQT